MRGGIKDGRAGGYTPVGSRADHKRTVIDAERRGRTVRVTGATLLGRTTVELDGAPISQIVPAKPLGVVMGRVLAVATGDRAGLPRQIVGRSRAIRAWG